MSFQSYLNNIQTKTGKTPSDFCALAQEKEFTKNGIIRKEIKATQNYQLVERRLPIWAWACNGYLCLFKR